MMRINGDMYGSPQDIGDLIDRLVQLKARLTSQADVVLINETIDALNDLLDAADE